MPAISVDISTGLVRKLISQEDNEQTECQHIIEMVVCSFALHLLEDASGLFALLWELSLKARWLVVLAPHKKPEVKIEGPPSPNLSYSSFYFPAKAGMGLDEMEY